MGELVSLKVKDPGRTRIGIGKERKATEPLDNKANPSSSPDRQNRFLRQPRKAARRNVRAGPSSMAIEQRLNAIVSVANRNEAHDAVVLFWVSS